MIVTSRYVLPKYLHVKISVWSRLLVPETNSMHQFMHDGPFVITPGTKRQLLSCS